MLFLNDDYHCIHSVWKTLLLHPLLDVVSHFHGYLVVSHYDFHCPNNWTVRAFPCASVSSLCLSLVKYLFHILLIIFIMNLWELRSLLFQMQVLYCLYDFQIFSLSLSFSFLRIYLLVVFWRTRPLIFDVQCVWLFLSWLCNVTSQEHFLILRVHLSFPLKMYHFRVSNQTSTSFRDNSYVRYNLSPKFQFLDMAVSVLKHHWLERLVFHQWITCRGFSKHRSVKASDSVYQGTSRLLVFLHWACTSLAMCPISRHC